MVKKTVLELGGSDPYIILADADIAASVRTCAASRLINGGQSCTAAKRFIVVESIWEHVEARFVTEMQAARMGDPLAEETAIGPLARHDLRDDLHQQVQASIAKGAYCLLGGTIPEGAFYWLAAQELEAGCCFVNTFVRSDPRLPFGGIKASGYRRELSHYGIKEFVNIKIVYVQ